MIGLGGTLKTIDCYKCNAILYWTYRPHVSWQIKLMFFDIQNSCYCKLHLKKQTLRSKSSYDVEF